MNRIGRASFTQERFYFLNELQPGNPAYVVAAALRIEGPLDRGSLARALRRVVARHDVLRTSFVVVDGELMQRVSDTTEPEITTVDREPVDRHTQDRQLQELVSAEARRPFHLNSGPVLRAWITSWDADQHALVLLVHHIACDGWAVGLLLDDLATEYNTAEYNTGRGGSPATGDRGGDSAYLAYAESQRAMWSQQSRRLDRWREVLAGAPQLSLYTDRPRPGVLSFEGSVLRRPVDPDLIRRLTAWAKERGSTLFGVALAAYALMLSRYTRQQEVVIGVPVANRLDEAEERLVGCLVNTLPIRVDLSGRPTFTELVTRTWRTALTALGHQDVPFEQIVRAMGQQRQLSHAPLFQTMLTVQNFTFTVPQLVGLTVAEVDVEIEAAKFDVAVTLDVSTSTPFLRAEFSTDLFDEASVAGMLTHYHTLLSSVVSDADPDGEPSMVSGDEHALLTQRWNPPVDDSPARHPSVLRSFTDHATRSPDAVAIRHRDDEVTYRDLDRWSTRIAAGLSAAGIGTGSRVGLLLRRSPAVVAAILGVWKAGGTYVPLDPEYPRHRLDLIVDSARPAVTIVAADTADLARQLVGDVALLDVHGTGDNAAPTVFPEPDDIAYVIYTSGSTGVPKGVMVRHRGLNALCHPSPGTLDVDRTDRWLGAHSFSFDVSVWELWGALSSGGRLIIADRADLVDPQRLARLIHAQRVTVLSLTPGALYRVLPPLFTELDRDRSSVRYVVLAGEALSWSRVAALVDPRRMPAVFVNMYGITEGTIHCTIVEVPATGLADVRDGDIGVPLPSARCYVLDDRRRPTGVGVPGELYVGGDVVAAGYVGMPELTAERFGPDPYGPGTLYRTGDIVKRAHDGTMIYIGREDAQVKVRGYRVELADVEAAFLRRPGVTACVVAARDDELIAFVTCGPEAGGERDLRAVRDELPGYMVPSRIVVVPQIPLNANGKVDVPGLLAAAASAAHPSASRAADGAGTADALTARIRRIWADVLERPDIETTDNFFDVGGHSFALITAQQRMADAGLEISVTDLFRFGTVAACAAHLRRAHTPSVDDAAAHRRRARDDYARRRRISRWGTRGDQHV